MDMSFEIEYEPQKCISCNKNILYFESSVYFPCPSCGEVIIWRCEKCRRFAREYTCPNCGFKGP